MSDLASLIIICGLSGAGKSSASRVLSDLGYFAVDNLPVQLTENFLKFAEGSERRYEKVSLLLEIESADSCSNLLSLLEGPSLQRYNPIVIFLDCSTETIVRRYSETRRPHPSWDPTRDSRLIDTIQRERDRLQPLKERANYLIDSSELTIHELKKELHSVIQSIIPGLQPPLHLNFLSFGYKYGLPRDCDLVLDIRFLPNPHFVDSLRNKTGLDAPVSEYVLASPEAQEFLRRISDILLHLLPLYQREGKSYLNVGIGCTGGQHRSVAISEEIFKRLQNNDSIKSLMVKMSTVHRDYDKYSLTTRTTAV